MANRKTAGEIGVSIRILVVEDEPRARNALHEYFSLCGFEVRSAGHASEAVVLGLTFRPQVLLCDWRLGSTEDGVEVARTLSESIDCLQILFMTGHSREKLEHRCGGLGVRRVYQKPLWLSGLSADIEALFNEET